MARFPAMHPAPISASELDSMTLSSFEPQSRAALLYMMTNPAYVLPVFHDASE